MNIYTQLWVGVYSAYIVAQCAEEWQRTGNAGAIVGNEDRFAEEAATVAELAVEAERRRRAAMLGPMGKGLSVEPLDPVVAGIVSAEGQREIREGLEAMLDMSRAHGPGGHIITNEEAHAVVTHAERADCGPRDEARPAAWRPTGRAAIIAQGEAAADRARRGGGGA